MKKQLRSPEDPDMLPEYDFSGAVRGKYYDRVRRSSNVVVLDADVAAVFPNAESVNTALRVLAGVARHASSRARKPSARARSARNGTKPARLR